MMQNNLIPVTIAGIGRYVPETVITNDDIAKIVDTNDEWIVSRTGIRQRRVVSGNETAVSLAINAAKDALAFVGMQPEQLDLIVVATSLPDSLYPSTACEVQAGIGAVNAVGFDIVAACSGLVFGMNIAKSFISSGTYENVLLIGVDIHTRFLDWTDRSTCILFGDGAGAMVVKKSDDGINDILSVDVYSDGTKANDLRIPVNGKNCPLVEPKDEKKQFVSMNGREIYKFAVNVVPESILSSLANAELSIENLDFLVPHQANMRIVSAITDRLNLNPEQVITNLDKYGNTSTASIPIALSEALENNKIPDSSILALCGFGAGLTWGTSIVRWRAKDKREFSNK